VLVFNQDERTPSTLCDNVRNVGYDPNAIVKQSSTGPFDVDVTVEYRINASWYTFATAENRTITGVLGGEYQQFCWNFTLAAGPWRATVFADAHHEVNESNESNNIVTTYFTIRPTPLPDLVPLSLQITPQVAKPGDTQAFSVIVANRGTAAASVVSWVDVTDSTGTLLARLKVPPLLVDQSVTLGFGTHPDQRPAGDFVATALVNSLGNVTESNTTNDAISAAFTILPHPEPDLTLENVTLNGTREDRHGLRVVGEIANAGNASAYNATLRLYLDGEAARDFTVPTTLTPNGTAPFQFFFVLTAGNHTIRVLADPDDLIAELDKSNNEWDDNVTILPTPANDTLPNLVVDRLGAEPLDPSPGEVVNVTGLVTNLGLTRSAPTTVAFYLGAQLLGSARVGGVAPGVSVSFRFGWATPPPGPYELRAMVNPQGLLNESDTSDDNYTIDFDVVPPTPEAIPINDSAGSGAPDLAGNATGSGAPTNGSVTIEPASGNGTILEMPQVTLDTRPVPGGVKGIVSVSLRNPSLDPLDGVTISFTVDGRNLVTKLVPSIAAAATTSLTSGEVDLPAGSHTIGIVAQLVGSDAPIINETRPYTAEAGQKSLVPALPLAGAALAALAVAVLRRRRG
jgi:subtilase family serine protease